MRTPVEAAENVEAAVLSSVEVHAEDGGEDEQHHGKVKHHNHCSLREMQKTLCYFVEKVAFITDKERDRWTFKHFCTIEK